MTDIRQPNITAATEREQLLQIRSYLYQLSQELQFALGNVEKQVTTVQSTAENAERQIRSASQIQTPKAQFSALKALIIKSADIVEAYYEEINRRLSGQYLAISDFGTYRQETEQVITENSQGITRVFSDVQTINTSLGQAQSDIHGISDSLGQAQSDIQAMDAYLGKAQDLIAEVREAVIQVNAWIKTGKLAEDDNSVPIYGVEIGQQTEADGLVVFQKFARLMADRLSFFDQNGNEVSFIGDETMHITKADIHTLVATSAALKKIQIGDYILFAGDDGHLTLS